MHFQHVNTQPVQKDFSVSENKSTEVTVNFDSAYGHFDKSGLISADRIQSIGDHIQDVDILIY